MDASPPPLAPELTLPRARELALGEVKGSRRWRRRAARTVAERGERGERVRGDPRLREKGQGPDLGTIARGHGDALRARQRLSWEQEKALRAAATCRTPARGGAVERCVACGFRQTVFRSCGNRYCSGCGAIAQERWVRSQYERTLEVPYFHTVLTLPAPLRPLCRQSPRELYGLLFSAGAAALREVAEERLGCGADLGLTCVLHTWGRYSTHHVLCAAAHNTCYGERAVMGSDLERRTPEAPSQGESPPGSA